MTGSNDAGTNGESDEADEASDSSSRASSLKDLANSLNQRRGGNAADRNTSTVDLDIDDTDSDEGGLFDWFDRGTKDDVESGRVPDAIKTSSSVLVLGPIRGKKSDSVCVDLLTLYPMDSTNVLLVTVTQSADDRISVWNQYADESPPNMLVLSLKKEATRTGTSSVISTQSGPGDITIETLSDPSDLTQLGIALSKHHSELASTADRTVMCIHSLTALLQYVEPQRMFRFLHILQGKLESHETFVHFHMDEDAHDQQTLRIFESLFDTVVRVTDDGELEVVSEPE